MLTLMLRADTEMNGVLRPSWHRNCSLRRLPELMDIYILAQVFLGDEDPTQDGTITWSRIKFTAMLPGVLNKQPLMT